MNNEVLKSLSNVIGDQYGNVGENNRNSLSKKIKALFENRQIPLEGFSSTEIQILISELANMDCNSCTKMTGMGEREGRIYSDIVKFRNYGFSHGIGRSGDVTALQPKAPGSSALNKLTNNLLLHLGQEMGFKSARSAVLFPMATGMTLVLCMLELRKMRPNAKYVIWPRIDQKSCFKSMITAGFEPLIVEPVLVNDELQTDVDSIKLLIEEKGACNILCVMSTTSCFAPRVPDNIIQISKLCNENCVPHLINNAYGVSLRRCMNVIEQASCRYGAEYGVWAVVQSTDKNLMVPVGGAFVLSSNRKTIAALSERYAGRASGSPSLDVFVTLLSMGVTGYRTLVQEREQNFEHLKLRVSEVGKKYGLKLMETPHNPVSIAVDLTSLLTYISDNKLTEIGAKLFHRSISGARIILSAESNKQKKQIEGYEFEGFGSHSAVSTKSYMNVAAGIGQATKEIDRFVEVLDEVLNQYIKLKQPEQGDR